MKMRNPMLLPSAGERQFLRAMVTVAIAGALVGGFILFESLEAQADVSLYRVWLSAAGAFGATVGVFLVRDNFGKPGIIGWIETFFAGLMATLLTGIIGGTLALPVYGTMFGAWLLFVSIVKLPILVFPLVAAISVMHRAMAVMRAERDTLWDWSPERALVPQDFGPHRQAKDPANEPRRPRVTPPHPVAHAKPSAFGKDRPPKAPR